jgi:hypothetical protein
MARELVPWLGRHRRLLDQQTVQRIADTASNPRIWHKAADASVDVAHLRTFEDLRAEVGRAG